MNEKYSLKTIFLTTLFVLNLYNSKVYSQDSLRVNNIEFEWGNNIFGNTISLGYKYKLSRHFGVGISVGKGYFRYDIGDKKSFLNFNNLLGKDNIFSIDMKQIINLKLSYMIQNQKGISFLNLYELGLASIHFHFQAEYKDENVTGEYVGVKNYNLYFLNFYFNLMEYRSSKNSNISFLIGLNNYLSMLATPQTITYYNGTNYPRERVMTSSTSKMLLFYPELAVRIIYSF